MDLPSPEPMDEAAARLAHRLAREPRPAGVRSTLLKAGRDGAVIQLHTDEAGARVVEKRVSRLAAARHASGELLFHAEVSDALAGGLLAPRPYLTQSTLTGARLLLEYVEADHWNLFRQAGELAGAVAAAEDELTDRLNHLTTRRTRLSLMTPLARPAWTRPRGGWPRRLAALARSARREGVLGPRAEQNWRRGLAALEKRILHTEKTLANADLIKPNLRYRHGRFVALDWGAVAVAPRGYDIGVLKAAVLRYDDRFVFRQCEARIREAAPLQEDRAMTAQYAFLVHALDHLNGPLFRALLQSDPALARDKIMLVTDQLDAL